MRLPPAAVALLFLALPGAAAACPLCAGSGEGPNIWPLVGAFLLVPPILGAGVITAMRREMRRGPDAPPPVPPVADLGAARRAR